MVDFTRRSIILGTAGIAAAGAGVTAAAGGLQGSVEGQADVQAEQALTVRRVSVASSEQDASFTRTSDDNTEFQAAVELNNGDSVLFNALIENSAADALDVEVAVDVPDAIDVNVVNSKLGSLEEVDPDDNGSTSAAVQTGEGSFVATIGDGSGGGDANEFIGIASELDDTADPGSYDIGVAINPLSTDN
jgi:hypothetical protein